MQSPGQAPSLEDRQAIVDVTVRYCWAIDGRDWAELANVFTEDARVDYGFLPTLHGLAEIQALVARVLAPLDGSQHMVTNHQIETREDGVRSRCYFHAQHIRRGLEGGENYVVAGIYRDAWSRSDAGWRIRSRELEVLWTEGNAAVVGRAPSDP
jgi:3-phenylpropionate/cinnamic acid dioxygenase small subunit